MSERDAQLMREFLAALAEFAHARDHRIELRVRDGRIARYEPRCAG